jgi:hypothetical protein
VSEGTDIVANVPVKEGTDTVANVPAREGKDDVTKVSVIEGTDTVANVSVSEGTDTLGNVPVREGTDAVANVPARAGTGTVANVPAREGTDVDVVVFQVQDLLSLVVACEFPVVAISDPDDWLADATNAASGTTAPIDACRRRNGRLGAAGVTGTFGAERR